jgi:hypothetical protein
MVYLLLQSYRNMCNNFIRIIYSLNKDYLCLKYKSRLDRYNLHLLINFPYSYHN